MSDNKSPPRQYRTDLHQFSVRCNPRLTNIIKTMSAERHTSYSDTMRLLMDLGLQTYDINKKAGITTGKKNEQETAVRKAKAEAAAAQRKRGLNTGSEAVTPLLYGFDKESE